MSIHLYISNKLEQLSKKFSQNNRIIQDVFSTEMIITQTSGMNSWLKLEVSQHNGIFSNYCFDTPNGLVGRIFQMAGLWSDHRYQTENLRWLLYSLLGEQEFIEKFTSVAQYYIGNDLKRLQLSHKMADLFDQYVLYRQDYIEAWNRQEHPVLEDQALKDDFEKQEAWQSWLWQKVKESFSDRSLDRVELKNKLLVKMKEPGFQEKIKSVYPRISLFGLSVLSDFHMEIFQALAQFLDIRFYLLNPSPKSYWYGEQGSTFKSKFPVDKISVENNELLDNYGSLAKDTFSLILGQDGFAEALDDQFSDAPGTNTLLEKIQNDIYQNASVTRNKIEEADLKDESIHIASSYTPVREVEALYNHLLNLYEKDSSLKPKDVLVQLSDVDLYTPYIKAVFDNAPVQLPYSIADRSYSGGDTIVGVLEMLMSLSEEDFSSEKVVQLLDSRFIRNKFDITDLDFIRDLVRQSNICLGIEGRAEDDTRYMSWVYGLEKMILGYAIKGGAEYDLDDYSTFPLDSFEGAEAHEMLRLKAFVDILIVAVRARKEERDLSGWKDYILNELLEPLIQVDEESSDEYKYISNHLASLDYVKDLMPNKISWEVFQYSFSSSLFSEVRGGHFMNGRITFCSILPMRSIPFKVIAMLGLDAGKFPRREYPLGFDLIPFESRRGDRQVKNNDRYLFLETLLSARKCLYLSYIGSNVKDNSELPPSLLLEELVDYIDSAAGNFKAKDYLFTQHPLHGFSRKYFGNKPQLFTYLNQDEELGELVDDESETEKETPDFSNIELTDLIRFCKDPFKFYYNRTLRIYYNQNGSLLQETELFGLDPLQQWSQKMELLQMDPTLESSYMMRGKKTGALPLANMASVCLDDAKIDIEGIRHQVLNYTQGQKQQHINIEIALGESRLKGSVDKIYGDKHICSNVSSETSWPKYLLEAWIKHLALMASGCEVDTLFIAKGKTEPLCLERNMLTRNRAKANLLKILKIYERGHAQIIPFMPNAGFKLVNENLPKNKMAIDLVREEGETNYFKSYFNEYIRKEIEYGFFQEDERSNQEVSISEFAYLLFEDICNLE